MVDPELAATAEPDKLSSASSQEDLTTDHPPESPNDKDLQKAVSTEDTSQETGDDNGASDVMDNLSHVTSRPKRTKNLSLKAREHKITDLSAQLGKLINESGNFIEKLYEGFETNNIEELRNDLARVIDNQTYITKNFNELVTLDEENRADKHTLASYNEHMEEINVALETVSTRIQELEGIEMEEKRIEEERIEKEAEVIKERRIFEQRKAKREEERVRLLERMSARKRNTELTLQAQDGTQSQTNRVETPQHLQSDRPGYNIHSGENSPSSLPPLGRDFSEPMNLNRMTPHSSTAESQSSIAQLADSINQSIKQTKRTMLEPKMFTGNPLQFADWEQDFEDFMDSQGISEDAKRVRYLKNYLDRDAKEAVEGQLSIHTAESYRYIRSKLKKRFGQKLDVARAIREKLDTWPAIKSGDSRGLQKYADYLDNVKANLSSNKDLAFLHNEQENEKLVDKLPEWVARKWATKLRQVKRDELRYPSFEEFSQFVIEEAEVMTEPVLVRRTSSKKPVESQIQPKASFKVRTLTTTTEEIKCLFCEEQHHVNTCEKMAVLPMDDRYYFIKTNRLCFACLNKGHSRRTCSEPAICSKCNFQHATALHKRKEDWEAERNLETKTERLPKPKTAVTGKDETTKLSTNSMTVATETDCPLSMIFPVWVNTLNKPGQQKLVYALVDSMSDYSYISKELACYLQPKGKKETVTVSTMIGESKPQVINKYTNLTMRGYNEQEQINFACFEWEDISCDRNQIPTRDNILKYTHLQAHANKLPPLLNIPVGLLIGRNCSDAFLPLESIISEQKGQPFAQRTPLGWYVLGGDNVVQISNKNVKSFLTSTIIESIDENRMLSQDDFRFLDILDQGIKRLDDQSLEMPLPFKTRPVMPDNYWCVEKRFISLKKKLSNNPALKTEYETFMEGLFSKGHAELVAENSHTNEGEVWYIPHFAVTHPRKKKVRVVFDCSAKYSKTSLNDKLLQGPDLMNSLVGILCRFREKPIAIACDVEKMFYNFKVAEKDRNFLRFLWYDKDGKTILCRMTVHLFGANSSPAVATYGLRFLADLHNANYPSASKFIQRDFYVDDGITSVHDVNEGRTLIQEARNICTDGNLRLHKFISNNKEVLQSLPHSELAETNVDLFKDTHSTQRTLGLEWAIKSDRLVFNNQSMTSQPKTRRGLLSVISQLFDPLGLLAPFILTGKNILREVNKRNSDWDENIPSDLEGSWEHWKTQLSKLDQLEIPRSIHTIGFMVERRELHTFSDASMHGIGACSYLKLVGKSGEVRTGLMLAKSKVIPSKGETTVPRLELIGALIATQLSETLKQELDCRIDQKYFWTDSTIVLGYLSNETKRFKVFVANRIREIRSKTNPNDWHHVPGDQNPADIASRGKDCTSLNNSIWFTGPKFIQSEESLSEILTNDKHIPRHVSDEDPEIKKVLSTKATNVTTKTSMYHRFKIYGSFQKLRTSIAYLKSMERNRSFAIKSVSPTDMESAEIFIVQTAQRHHFSEDIENLRSNGRVNDKSRLRPLDPFLDQNGLLRVGGRVQRSNVLGFVEKHPLIMPKDSHVSHLIIEHYHMKTFHQGRGMTTAAVRTAGYWILGLSRMVRGIVGRCVPCKRIRSVPTGQKMGLLPKERVTPSPAFTHIGIDCFGPFHVKDRRTEAKRWGLIISCMYSRAVHIEVLESMSTDSFINSLRNFMCIRGQVKTIFCDNGTNFMGARNEFLKGLEQLKDSKAIEFRFNSPYASHQGGTWERQIRTARSILSGIGLKMKCRMDTPTLRTAFYEAMATMNSKPLTVENINNPNEVVLTPNHLLTMKTGNLPSPPTEFDGTDVYSKKMWRRAQRFADMFWDEWKISYLKEVSKRQKWSKEKRNLQVGDIVILQDDGLKRNEWQTGIIEEATNGSDSLVRKVTIRLANQFLDRFGKPMVKPARLERAAQKVVVLVPKDE